MNQLLIVLALVGAGSADMNPGGVSNVRGFARGADALTFDPAGTAFVDGLELQYEQFSIKNEHSLFGAYGIVPMGPLRLQAGYEWVPLTNRSFERGSIGLSAKLSETFAVGFTYRGYRAYQRGFREGGTWDIGFFAVPFQWLSISMGIDDVGSPYLLDARQNFHYSGGIAIRPVLAAPWLTLGAQTQLDGRTHDFAHTRAVVDVGGRGVHVYGAYDFQNEFVAVGLQLGIGPVELRQAFELQAGDEARSGTGREELASATVVTFRANPSESLGDWQSGRTVELALTGQLTRKSDGLFGTREMTPTIGWRLRRLAREPSVGTVVLKVGHLDVGMGFVDELRAEIMNLRAAGKRVVAELGYADDKSYLVAAAADVVRLDKSAIIGVDGFALLAYYFGAALEHLGIRFDVVAIGRYKSAPDALTSDRPRPEDDEVRSELLAQAQSTLETALKERGLDDERVASVLRRGGVRAEEARGFGLVDEVAELDIARPNKERAHTADDLLDRASKTWGQAPIVAVVPVVGTIVREDDDNPLPGESASAVRIVKQLTEAGDDPRVAGVVVRVDSGGGEIFASELIYRAVLEVQRKKPIVASMADTAASGGYYVIAGADTILAEPNTLTGSIGIFQLKLDLSGLYKLTDIKPYTYRTGPLADWRYTTHGFNDDERARLTQILSEEYDEFLAKVAAGRKLPIERVRELAEGRVYSGLKALQVGLVDRLGGLADAVDEVRRRAHVTGEVDVHMPSAAFSLGNAVSKAASITASPLEHVEALHRRLLRWEHEPLALMPETFEVVP
ncbi:MAG: signal peptide peptidase SppA [Myxococcota bacterium]